MMLRVYSVRLIPEARSRSLLSLEGKKLISCFDINDFVVRKIVPRYIIFINTMFCKLSRFSFAFFSSSLTVECR